MSWEALAWAKDSEIAQPVAKFILVLLANKADENFSCYPSIRTLMTESGAGRSTVLRALSFLETRGFMTRRPQFHDSGARRSTRYFLNHPRAPHLPPGPDPALPSPDTGPPGPVSARESSRRGTGAVSQRHPTGVPDRDPLKPSIESPSEPGGSAAQVLHAVSDSWRLGERDAHSLLPAIESALARGWPAVDLAAHLIRNPDGARHPIRVIGRRLTQAWAPPGCSAPTVPWCGGCEDAYSRTITVAGADGSEAARFCPRCSPQAHKDRRAVQHSVDSVERW